MIYLEDEEWERQRDARVKRCEAADAQAEKLLGLLARAEMAITSKAPAPLLLIEIREALKGTP